MLLALRSANRSGLLAGLTLLIGPPLLFLLLFRMLGIFNGMRWERGAVSRSCVDDFWTLWSKNAEAVFLGRTVGLVVPLLYRVSQSDEVDVQSAQYLVNSSLALVLLFHRRLKSVADLLKQSRWEAFLRY